MILCIVQPCWSRISWLLPGRAVFFFQAEDGIRDGHVTGVQTCALPIFVIDAQREALARLARREGDVAAGRVGLIHDAVVGLRMRPVHGRRDGEIAAADEGEEIGRASCRERGKMGWGGSWFERTGWVEAR